MVEPRRKHGSFDPRYPTLSTPATPTWVLRADAGFERTEFLLEKIQRFSAEPGGTLASPFIDRTRA